MYAKSGDLFLQVLRKYIFPHQNDEHHVFRPYWLGQRDHDQQHERKRGDWDHNPCDGAAGGGDGDGDGVCGAAGGDDERTGGGAGREWVECEFGCGVRSNNK